jgi:hypothetical protein
LESYILSGEIIDKEYLSVSFESFIQSGNIVLKDGSNSDMIVFILNLDVYTTSCQEISSIIDLKEFSSLISFIFNVFFQVFIPISLSTLIIAIFQLTGSISICFIASALLSPASTQSNAIDINQFLFVFNHQNSLISGFLVLAIKDLSIFSDVSKKYLLGFGFSIFNFHNFCVDFDTIDSINFGDNSGFNSNSGSIIFISESFITILFLLKKSINS